MTPELFASEQGPCGMKFLLQSVFSLLVLSFVPSAAWAQTYHLPSSPPPGCSVAGSVITCSGWRTFGSGVVITVDSPVTLNMSGGGAIEGAQINVGGNPDDLTINVTGNNLNLGGSNTRIVASLSAPSIQNSNSSNAQLTGTINVAGQLALGDGAQVAGSVTAGSLAANDSSNVVINGNVSLTGQLSLGSQSQIMGSIVAGSVQTGQNNIITGDVDVAGTITLGQSSTINGNVEANLVNINSQATVNGSVQSNTGVNLSQGATVGAITAAGSVSIADNAVIHGGIESGGQVTLGQHAVVHGGVQAVGQISIHNHAAVYGPVQTDSQVTVYPDVVVQGNVTAGTNIQIHERSHVFGDLNGNNIDISLDVVVEGNVEAGGYVSTYGVIQGNVNANGPVWLQGNGSCSVDDDGRLEPEFPGQGGTQGCVRGYVNAPNDHQIPPGNVGGIICDQNDNVGPCTGSGGSSVMFYRIINPGTVLTCESLALEVHACADINCLTGQPLTGAVTVQAAGAQTYSSTGGFANSSVSTINMAIPTVGSYTLNVTAAPEIATDPVQCQGPNGCQVTAVDSVLRWSETGYSDIPHQTAGMAFQLEIEAIRTDSQTSACAAALQGVTTLDLSLDCLDPGACSSDGLQYSSLAATGLAEWPASGTIPVSFDTNGRAVLGDMIYEDAGRIRLHASADIGGGSSITGWSSDFVVRPATVGLQVTNAVTYNPDILARAGDDLVVTLSALSHTGRITRNFGLESSPESLLLLPQAMAVIPSGGADGVITTEQSFAMSQGGQFTGVVRYSEAGTARFSARIASQNYLFSGVGASGYLDVGRFLPWEFRVEAVGTAVEMACSVPTPEFTYLGEPFETSLRISARNRAGTVTQNYPDESFEASATLVARDIEKEVELSERMYKDAEPMEAMPLALTWTSPLAGYGINPDVTVVMERLAFDQDDPADAGPFGSVTLGVEVNDNEPGGPFVPLANADFRADVDDCEEEGPCTAVTLMEDARFVHGRMILTDTMGSEFSALPVTLQVHYWDGERFRLHQHDQCTVVDVDNLTIIENLLDLDTNPEGVNDTQVSNGFSPPNSLVLTAPVTAGGNPLPSPGEVTFRYRAPDWLQSGDYPQCPSDDGTDCHPVGTAVFGTYGGHDRVIHWKLVH